MSHATKETGALGEDVATQYLIDKGFAIVSRNYRKKYGEIDIIARKESIIHFIEVKTVSYETKKYLKQAVLRGTWRPEEQVHQFKMKQIAKALETWIFENKYEGEWVIDVMGVRIVPHETYVSVNLIENVIL